jgi:hypothetical protein
LNCWSIDSYPISKEELGVITTSVEQRILMLVPGFDLIKKPHVLVQGKDGIELMGISTCKRDQFKR